jgi:RND family efflux transporter MFP subunit
MAASSRPAQRRAAWWAPLLLLAPLLGGCNQQSNAKATAQAAPPVTVAHPLVKKITEWDEYTGRFEAEESVDIRARVSGYLQSVHFKDGQMVDKDQLLFVIDPRPFQIAVDRAKADLENAHARLELATLEADRAAKLVNTSALSQSTYDQRQQEKQSAAASVGSAEAAERQAELDLFYTNVTSPIAGRMSNRRVDVGNFVNGDGSTLLSTVVSLDPIHFVFDATEGDYLRYERLAREGRRQSSRDVPNPVFLRLSDEQGWPHQGHMDFVDNVVDRSTGTIRGRAIFANPDLQLTPGTFGRIRLLGSGEYEAVMIPDEAIVADQSRKLVMTVAADGTVQPKPIEPGPLVDGLRVIRQGLTGDDRIVIEGVLRARPGGKVTPKEGNIQAAAAD